MTKQFFGTDGIRGRVGTAPITADFVLRLGWAAGKVFGRRTNGRKLILIGKDTRESGYMFESALQAGIISAGVDVGLLGPMPTPAIAYLSSTFRAQAGIVISASHNPYYDNGIKFFDSDGRKLPDEVEVEIEGFLEQDMKTSDSGQLGRANRIADAAGRYIEFCKGTLPGGFELGGLKLVVDCANGATYHIAPDVMSELGAEVVDLGVSPDGLNINLDCGSTSPAALQKKVLEQQADLGIAFDGDGDRVIFVDHKGELVDGDELLYVIARHRHENRDGCNGVAGTLMSNLGLELALRELQIPFARSNVGDRYVIETMRQNQWNLGGEGSGHIICGDVTTTGDGIVSALQVLRALKYFGQSLHDCKRGMKKFPQVMVNVRGAEKFVLDEHPPVQRAMAEAQARLADRGRILLRPSGTEPVVRVMVEGEEIALINRIANELAEVVRTGSD